MFGVFLGLTYILPMRWKEKAQQIKKLIEIK